MSRIRSNRMDYKGLTLETSGLEINGVPVDPNGGTTTVDWADVENKPTSFPTTWADVDEVPVNLTAAQAAGTASIRAIGTTATTAAAGNHNHAVTADADSGLAAAANIQALAVALSARIKALEDAAP